MGHDSELAKEGGRNEDVEADESTRTEESRSRLIEDGAENRVVAAGSIAREDIVRDVQDDEEDGAEQGTEDNADEDEEDQPDLVSDNDSVLEPVSIQQTESADILQPEEDDSDLPDQLSFNGQPVGISQRSPLASPARSDSIVDDSTLQSDPFGSSPGRAGSPIARRSYTRTPSGAAQPFDRRFEARPLVSPSSSFRAASPAFLSLHSRQISLSSQISQISSQDDQASNDTPKAPWEVVRWTKLKKITGQAFSEAGKRNFGRPTCMAVSALIAIGTSKGLVLGFDYHQTLKIIVGPGTKAVECGSVTALSIAADYTTIAAGHANGHIFTWEISRPARPFLQIPPISPVTLQQPQHEDGHLTNSAILHLAFLGTRHTALVSADSAGMAFSHIASRGLGPVTRSITTTRLLGRYPAQGPAAERPKKPSSVLAFAPLPLGNVEQSTDNMGLTAMLTPYLLVIVSTIPIAQTQYKASRPKEMSPHSTLSGCLAWFPAVKLKNPSASGASVSSTKLVYCWSNIVTVIDVELEIDPNDTARPPSLNFSIRSRWHAEEAIVAVQWLGRSVLGLLTISQRLLIVEDGTLRVTDSIDLLHRRIYHQDIFSEQLHDIVEQLNSADPSLHGVVADAFFMSFKAYKGRTFLLGFNDLSIGTLSNWADRLIALMEMGDHLAALRLATEYYSGGASNVTIGLPEDDSARHRLVRERILAMITASTQYTFALGAEERDARLPELAETCFEACVIMKDVDFLCTTVFEAFSDAEEESIFAIALEPYILDGDITALPPEVVKAMVGHYVFENQAARLEELLCRLDPLSFDLDQMTTLCRQHSLYDALIYVWTQAIGDYVSPLIDLLGVVKLLQEGFAHEDLTDNPFYESAMKVFPFLAYSLTGRRYPRGSAFAGGQADQVRRELYSYLFAGTPTPWPSTSETVFLTSSSTQDEPVFPYINLLLRFDIASFMSMLNEAFEDPFLNVVEEDDNAASGIRSNGIHPNQKTGSDMTRQHIVEILLDVMRQESYDAEHIVFLDMFIARNLPKYPGQMILSGSLLDSVLASLCRPPLATVHEDCQLSIEYLLSVHRPSNVPAFVDALRQAQFFRILKSLYRSEKMHTELLECYFEDSEGRENVFTCISSILRTSTGLTDKQRSSVEETVIKHFQDLVEISIVDTARTLAAFAPGLLQACLDDLQTSHERYVFLRALLEPSLDEGETARSPLSRERQADFVELYVQLMCENEPHRVADYVRALPTSDLRLEAVMSSMESAGVVDATVYLLVRDGLAREAMDRLVSHLQSLEQALSSLTDTVLAQNHDLGSVAETVQGLVEDIEKYTQVGVWLCRSQNQASVSASASLKPARPHDLKAEMREDDLEADEFLWLSLLDVVVQVTQSTVAAFQHVEEMIDDGKIMLNASSDGVNTLEPKTLIATLRSNVQQVFTALLATTASSHTSGSDKRSPQSQEQHDRPGNARPPDTFLRILRAFLTRAARTAPSLAELRTVLGDILSVYSFEQDVLALATGLLDADLFLEIDRAHRLRQRGWRPKSQVCEHCKRRAWGTGIGDDVWRDFAAKEHARLRARVLPAQQQGKGKAVVQGSAAVEDIESGGVERLTLVVFACRHVYHRRCLDERNRGMEKNATASPPSTAAYSCPVCHTSESLINSS